MTISAALNHYLPIHKKRNIFDMVFLISGKDIKKHQTKELADFCVGETELPHYLSSLLIAVCAGQVEIKVRHAAQGLHMVFCTCYRIAVKSTCHEMITAAFFV